jgi:transcriptional regulator with XRE-family HTH domain
MTFGEKLARLTTERRIPKSHASTAAKLPANAISDYISKGYVPRADTALRIAHALGVTLDWLADDTQEWPPPDGKTRGELTITTATDDELRIELAQRYRRLAASLYDNLNRAEKVDWARAAAEVEKLPAKDELPKHIQELERLARSIEQAFYGAQGFGLTAGLITEAYLEPHPRIEAEELAEAKLIKRFVVIEKRIHTLMRAIERRKRPGKSA